MNAHAGIRDRELIMRAAAGLPLRRRGGSDKATDAALKAIEALSSAVDPDAVTEAVRDLESLTRPILEHPAIDQAEPWRKIRGYACPYCKIEMVYARSRALQVTCIRYGVCWDSEGKHPMGHMEISQLTANPIIRWNDGLVAS